jgi:hypothetical protein
MLMINLTLLRRKADEFIHNSDSPVSVTSLEHFYEPHPMMKYVQMGSQTTRG